MSDVRPVTVTASPTSRGPHLPALDGLRGVAILGVLVFHTGHLPGGFLGVDLFFALSGYLITDLLLREIGATETVGLAGFWGRRIRRLLPALAVMLAVVTVVVWAAGPPDLVRTTLADGPWVQLNLVNWHLLAESAGYWDRFGTNRVFEHLWSIAVEEQFYLLWPLVLLGLAWGARRVDRGVVVVAGVASVISLLMMIVLVGPADPSRVYIGTDTRAFSLLLGVVVATPPAGGPGGPAGRPACGRRGGTGRTRARRAVVGRGRRWCAVVVHRRPLRARAGGRGADRAVCAGPGHGGRDRSGVAAPAWTGLVSYSLYLWHWPVFVLLRADRGWPHAAAACVVSFDITELR